MYLLANTTSNRCCQTILGISIYRLANAASNRHLQTLLANDNEFNVTTDRNRDFDIVLTSEPLTEATPKEQQKEARAEMRTALKDTQRRGLASCNQIIAGAKGDSIGISGDTQTLSELNPLMEFTSNFREKMH